MKEKIEQIYIQALIDDVAPNVFADQVLRLLDVSNSVFIVCQNDDYGRDLYLCTKNTLEGAKEIKGMDNTRNIYEHKVSETDC
jgi:hypothetical protein